MTTATKSTPAYNDDAFLSQLHLDTEVIDWSDLAVSFPTGPAGPGHYQGATSKSFVSGQRSDDGWRVRVPGLDWIDVDNLPRTITERVDGNTILVIFD